MSITSITNVYYIHLHLHTSHMWGYSLYGPCWVSVGIIVVLVPAEDGLFFSFPFFFAEYLKERARGDVAVPSALPPSLSRGCGKVTGCKGDGSQFHEIHRIFHKWMNTISFQFPHYANMQNIKSRPI